MANASEAIDTAIREVTTARTLVSAIKSRQIRSGDALASLKATALTWFNTHRKVLVSGGLDLDFTQVDTHYRAVLDATSKHASRKTYLDSLRDAKKSLVGLRSAALIAPSRADVDQTDDVAPDFSPLAANEEMRTILVRRWNECWKCVGAEAHLAAIVMMGGLLEALFVARANKLPDKAVLTTATSAPKDRQTGKTTNYQEWMLDSYLKVGRELNWITDSAKNVADVLKEYRNYVHPEKERRHGVTLGLNDSLMFWVVTKALVRQLLVSARIA